MPERPLAIALIAIAGVATTRSVTPQLTPKPGVRVQLRPVDQAEHNPSLRAARERLLQAVKQRDAAFVIDMLAPGFRLQGVTDYATEGLARGLRSTERELGAGITHAYWRGLQGALTLGGAFSTTRGAQDGRDEFCAPYVYAAYPPSLPAALQGEGNPWVVLGEDVPLLVEPRYDALVVARLSYDLVKVTNAEVRGELASSWTPVELADRRQGYVPSELVRDPDDYHVCLAAVGDRWLITAIGRGRSP
jgi:hypothetical protein